MLRRWVPIAAVVGLLAMLIGQGAALAVTFDQHPFYLRWARTDLPVSTGDVHRTWIWGPEPISVGLDEAYAESPGGMRRVQYFDKSRMEINDPNANSGDLWYVTNGLLVVEMATGRVQVGDNQFEDAEPAQVLVAGDQSEQSDAPSYAVVGQLMDEPARPVGELIIERASAEGAVYEDELFVNAGVTGAYLAPETGHVVASVFWEFMNSSGIVADDAMYFEDELFINPFYATGLPITEAYWTTIPVGGVLKDVLFQCFERRCLTYTPANELGWQVEAGNVGRHYFEWRYGEPATMEVMIFLVAIGDDGQSGEEIGCDDSLVGITREIPTTGDPIQGALEALLAIPGPNFGESGLSTALHDWNVTVDSVNVENGLATVEMSGDISIGGVCDAPRIEHQLERTVLQFPDVDQVQIFINGEALEDILSVQ